MLKVGLSRRRGLVAALGALYVLVSLPLAETGGDILGGSCDEPSDLNDEVCQAITPQGVDAWQVIPVVVVVVLVVGALYRGSFQLAHTALALCLVLTLVLPLLFAEVFL